MPRTSWLKAACLTAAFALLSAEALSLFHAVTRPWLLLSWAAFLALARPWRRWPGLGWPALGWPEACVLLLLGLALVLALASAPNNLDSMFYHLARVEHWRQSASLHHFPANYHLQLSYPPLAEVLLLHAHVLTGGDRLDNLLQWSALAGCVAASARLGGRWAALLMATLPMALLQASSTQNDLLLSFFILAAACFAREGEAAWFGLAAGLGLATKGTAAFYLLPLGLLLLKHRPAPLALAAALLLALLPSAGHFQRNLSLWGSLYGPAAEHLNGRIGAGALASNLAKNLASELAGFPWARANAAVLEASAALQRGLGVDPADPGLNWKGSAPGQYGLMSGASTHEDYAANPLHLILALLALWAAGAYGLAAASGLLLYCLFIRWNPWCTRLHLPFFALAAAPIGLWLSRLRSPAVRGALAALLVAAALPCVLDNATRPMLGRRSVFKVPRTQQYFFHKGGFPGETQAVALEAARFSQVGLALSDYLLEYPLWILCKRAHPAMRLEHVAAGHGPPAKGFDPEAVIFFNPTGREIPYIRPGSDRFDLAWRRGPYQLMKRRPAP